MKSLAFATATILLTGWIASGQEEPKFGAFLGYQYNRFTSNDNSVFGSNPPFSANGGDAELIVHFNRWFGAVADIGAIHKGSFAGFDTENTFVNYLFGPRISFARRSRVSPFFQVLFGGMYQTSSVRLIGTPAQLPPVLLNVVPPDTAVTTRIGATQNAFAM